MLVLHLFDAEDVNGALVAGEQILSIVGVEEFAQRLDTPDNEQEVVLAFERIYGINEVVPGALLAELDFQTVGEEDHQIGKGRR